MSDISKTPKTLIGDVVSNKMDKTITVRISRKTKHPLYEKYVKRSTKLMAHDANNECKEGDMVMIAVSKPISKNKVWTLTKIIRPALKD